MLVISNNHHCYYLHSNNRLLLKGL